MHPLSPPREVLNIYFSLLLKYVKNLKGEKTAFRQSPIRSIYF